LAKLAWKSPGQRQRIPVTIGTQVTIRDAPIVVAAAMNAVAHKVALTEIPAQVPVVRATLRQALAPPDPLQQAAVHKAQQALVPVMPIAISAKEGKFNNPSPQIIANLYRQQPRREKR
jgi:hypothetical protein